MKKMSFIFAALLLPVLAQAHSILDFLEIEPSEQSQDFVENKKQFQLHTLVTEQRHPKTWALSSKIHENTSSGIEALLSVDSDICEKILELSQDTKPLEKAVEAIKLAILENKKIYIYGCGATGRLAKQMESSFWRPFWNSLQKLPQWEKIKDRFPNIENRLIGEMTGGDRALISSLEGFEDLQLIGKLQLEDRGIEKGDVVFAITEGGETSSVIGTVLSALKHYDTSDPCSKVQSQEHLYFIYNNPDKALLPFDRSRLVLENEGITKICLCTGPQSITGSTRMQATTIETFVMGVILEQAIYELLKPSLSIQELEFLGFGSNTLSQRLCDFLELQKTVYETRNSISAFTDLEASIYEKEGLSTYFAKEALITVFIDSTERAPTFRLFPLDTCEAIPRKSWIQVWTPAKDKLDAWQNFLGRSFYGLNKNIYEKPFLQDIDDPYLRMAALRSLSNATDEQQFLYDFSYSQERVKTHGPKKGDLGVMVLFGDEVEALTSSDSIFQTWLNLFREKEANVCLILVSPSKSVLNELSDQNSYEFFNPIIVHLQIEDSLDPLKLRKHVGLKMLLNAHSTGVMAKLGRVVGNTMTNVNPGNLKLIGRATFLILSHVNNKLGRDQISYQEANAVLFDAIEHSKKKQKVGEKAEVALCIIRILESLRSQKYVAWEAAEEVLQSQGLEGYLEGWDR